MSDIINKKDVTLDEALDSKSLKKLKTPQLERTLQTLLCDESDNDSADSDNWIGSDNWINSI